MFLTCFNDLIAILTLLDHNKAILCSFCTKPMPSELCIIYYCSLIHGRDKNVALLASIVASALFYERQFN